MILSASFVVSTFLISPEDCIAEKIPSLLKRLKTIDRTKKMAFIKRETENKEKMSGKLKKILQ